MSAEEVTEYTVIAKVALHLPADSAEDAARKAFRILEAVDGWPSTDIDDYEVWEGL